MSEPSEDADVETSSELYARRFAGPVGGFFLDVQTRTTLDLLRPFAGASVLGVGGGHGQLAGPSRPQPPPREASEPRVYVLLGISALPTGVRRSCMTTGLGARVRSNGRRRTRAERLARSRSAIPPDAEARLREAFDFIATYGRHPSAA